MAEPVGALRPPARPHRTPADGDQAAADPAGATADPAGASADPAAAPADPTGASADVASVRADAAGVRAELQRAPAERHRALEEALSELERRRRDRWVVVAVLVVAVVAALALLVVDEAVSDLAPWAALAFLAVGVGYGATVVAQERRSRRAVRAIVAERERAAAASARIGALEELQHAAREVVAAEDLEDVFERLLAAARRLTGAASGVVLLRVGDELTVAAAAGPDGPDRGEAFHVEAGAAGTAVTTGEPLLVGRGAPWGAAAGASSIAAPMRLPERTVGVLVVTRGAEHPAFTATDLAIVALFADHAALAVRNASRLDSQRRGVQQARAEVAGLAEDLQGSLSVVSGYAALLRQRGDGFTPERRRALLDDLLAEVGAMQQRLGPGRRH